MKMLWASRTLKSQGGRKSTYFEIFKDGEIFVISFSVNGGNVYKLLPNGERKAIEYGNKGYEVSSGLFVIKSKLLKHEQIFHLFEGRAVKITSKRKIKELLEKKQEGLENYNNESTRILLKPYVYFVGKNTFEHKDKIKKNSFKWTERELSCGNKQKFWTKPLADLIKDDWIDGLKMFCSFRSEAIKTQEEYLQLLERREKIIKGNEDS